MKNPENLLLLASAHQVDKAIDRIKMMEYMLKLDQSPLAGIVITGEGELEKETRDYVTEKNIPLIHTMLDTYSSVIKVSKSKLK